MGTGASITHGKIGSKVHGEGQRGKALGDLASDAVKGALSGKVAALAVTAV